MQHTGEGLSNTSSYEIGIGIKPYANDVESYCKIISWKKMSAVQIKVSIGMFSANIVTIEIAVINITAFNTSSNQPAPSVWNISLMR